jgi:hypothetical protein
MHPGEAKLSYCYFVYLIGVEAGALACHVGDVAGW